MSELLTPQLPALGYHGTLGFMSMERCDADTHTK